MPRTYNSLVNINHNLLAAVDVETTGTMPGYHEIIQIAVQPLNSDMEPLEDVHPFYWKIAPMYPERAEKEATIIHGIDIFKLAKEGVSQERVADLFDEWFQRLELPFRKSLVPLAHNWAFEAGFLKAWLGMESFNQFFHPHPRDSMLFAVSINDRAHFHGEQIPFPTVGLSAMCKQLHIPVINAHDALADALAEAKVYKTLMMI